MPLSYRVARFNRRVTNRVLGPLASRLPGFGVVIHTGRASGRTYQTPVNVFRDVDDYVIALTYGAQADWVRNVQAAGGCTIVIRGRRIRLGNPRLVTDPRQPWAPLVVRQILGLTNVTQYLRLARATAPQRELSAPTP